MLPSRNLRLYGRMCSICGVLTGIVSIYLLAQGQASTTAYFAVVYVLIGEGLQMVHGEIEKIWKKLGECDNGVGPNSRNGVVSGQPMKGAEWDRT